MSYIESLFNLDNKVAVITGGAGILGGEMAGGLNKAGSDIILLDLSQDRIDEKIRQCFPGDAGVNGYECDVLDRAALESVKNEIIRKYKKIDILINAAGGNIHGATIQPGRTIFDIGMEDFKAAVNLNLYGSVTPSLVFGKAMAENKSGVIINISSMTSSRVVSRVAAYSAAKAAINNFTKWLAVEMATQFGEHIRVNAVAPGFFITGQNRDLLLNKDDSLTERGKTIINHTPFRRFGTPDELIGTVLWLAGDASRFVTGTVIPIDGGFSIFSGV